MTDESDIGFEQQVAKYESHAHWGGVAVAVGLVIECALAFIFHHGKSPIENWAPVLADVLVAAGVGAEVLFAAKASNLQREIKRLSDAKVAELIERAAQLEFESGFAQERAAGLEKEAAEARRETERLKKEVSWRVLDEGASRRLIAELSKIPARVTLVYLPGDPEATFYNQRFYEVFIAAGWQVEVVARTFMGPPVGIFVTHGDRWNPAIEAGMLQLRNALVTAGIQVESGGGPVEMKQTGFRAATNDLMVVIGHKPPPQIV